jgi:hypothetical protein
LTQREVRPACVVWACLVMFGDVGEGFLNI